MDNTIWRAYRIEDKTDLTAALQSYERFSKAKPSRALVSAKAPDWLLALVQETNLEIEQADNLLPRDVWLTHETEVEVQLSFV